jgi:hypothetical protein
MTPPVNELSASVNEGWALNFHLGGGGARSVRLDALRKAQLDPPAIMLDIKWSDYE